MKENDDVIFLLLNGTHEISKEMKKYIATPWCHCDNTFKNCKYCRYKPKFFYKINNEKKCINQEPQSHGGDLFQHSQWSALYLTMWYLNKPFSEIYLHNLLEEIANSTLLKNVLLKSNNKINKNTENKETIKRFIQLCGFMHDIGKGGDGFKDMYSKDKYKNYKINGLIGEQKHPEVCKIAIIEPDNFYKGKLKIVLDDILNSYQNSNQAKFILALVAAVHWNFGKLFDIESNYSPETYVIDFFTQIKDINQKIFNNQSDVKINFPLLLESEIIIKLCMIVSCSDIASANNKELLGEINEEINICNNTKNNDIFENKKIDNILVSKCNYTSYGKNWRDIKKLVVNKDIPLFQKKMNNVIEIFNQKKNEQQKGGRKPKTARKFRKLRKSNKSMKSIK